MHAVQDYAVRPWQSSRRNHQGLVLRVRWGGGGIEQFLISNSDRAPPPSLPAGPSNHAWQGLLVRLFPPVPRGRGSAVGGLLRVAQRVGLDQLLYVRLAALSDVWGNK